MNEHHNRNLADFKRFLAKPGATILLEKHEGLVAFPNDTDEERRAKREAMFQPRTVQKLQTNGVQFSNGSWLYFDSASKYRFDGHRVTVDLNGDGHFSRVMTYACHIPE